MLLCCDCHVPHGVVCGLLTFNLVSYVQVVLFAVCCTLVLQLSEVLVGDHAVELAAELDPF
jgi:hypothetical protein